LLIDPPLVGAERVIVCVATSIAVMVVPVTILEFPETVMPIVRPVTPDATVNFIVEDPVGVLSDVCLLVWQPVTALKAETTYEDVEVDVSYAPAMTDHLAVLTEIGASLIALADCEAEARSA